jgi:hypothetical protein
MDDNVSNGEEKVVREDVYEVDDDAEEAAPTPRRPVGSVRDLVKTVGVKIKHPC